MGATRRNLSPMSDYPPPPSQPPAYGQPYGAQPYVGQPSGRRPGTVTAAGILTLVFSVLTGLAFVGIVVAFQAARSDMVDSLQGDPTFDDFDPDTIVNAGVVVSIVVVVWCVVAAVLGVLVMKRSRVARVLLVVSSVVAALISLVGILSLISALPLIASIATVVLLFTGGANDWFAKRDGTQPPPPLGTTAY